MQPTRSLTLRVLAFLILLLGLAPAGTFAAQVQVEEDDPAGLEPAWLEDALNDFWEAELEAVGVAYQAPEVIAYERTTETACGNARRRDSPFYCPADETIYVSVTRSEQVIEESGEASWVIEVSHAWGTMVIWQLDLAGDADEDAPAASPDDAPFLSWCLGGAFIGSAVDDDNLTADDVDDAIDELEDAFDADVVDEFLAGYDDGTEGCGLEPARDDDDGDVGGVEPDGVDGVYESPLYGYTVAYDPDVWEIFLEDDDPDDVYDQIFFTNGPSVIGVTGDPDYDDDEMAGCVEDYVFGLEQGRRNSNVEPLDERGAEGEDDDRAWATYSYTYEFDDGSEDDYIRYYECIWLDDGVTLVILHDAHVDDYDDEIEAREEFVAGIEVAGGDQDDDEPADEDDDEPADEDDDEPIDEDDDEEDDDTI